MKLYELTYLLPIDMAEEETKSLSERINSYIIESQGTLDKVEDLVKKRLGEPIKKQNMAQLFSMSFYLDQEKIADFESKIKNEKQVLHHMVLNKKPKRMIEPPRRARHIPAIAETELKTNEKPKKVEIKEIEKKLEEILGE